MSAAGKRGARSIIWISRLAQISCTNPYPPTKPLSDQQTILLGCTLFEVIADIEKIESLARREILITIFKARSLHLRLANPKL